MSICQHYWLTDTDR